MSERDEEGQHSEMPAIVQQRQEPGVRLLEDLVPDELVVGTPVGDQPLLVHDKPASQKLVLLSIELPFTETGGHMGQLWKPEIYNAMRAAIRFKKADFPAE